MTQYFKYDRIIGIISSIILSTILISIIIIKCKKLNDINCDKLLQPRQAVVVTHISGETLHDGVMCPWDVKIYEMRGEPCLQK